MANKHPQWSSRTAFIMASAGAAVGLGNIWKFPYVAGQSGGGAFVLVYLVCVIVLGIPLMMAEVLIGRRGRQNPSYSAASLARASGKSSKWGLIGALTILAGFLINTYYCVITGWVLDFIGKSVQGIFANSTREQISQIFDQLLSDPSLMLLWDTVFIVCLVMIISLGLKRGLEKTVYFMFPALIVIIVVLVFYAMDAGNFRQGLAFLFTPKFGAVRGQAILAALGQAFFSLSIATGIMMTYGAYLPKGASIAKTSIIICITDTLVALLAGMVIFPIVFAHGLTPAAGAGLIFKSLPIAFGQMPHGEIFATLFFVMLLFAAFTSAIALLEPAVLWLIEKFNWPRYKAAIVAGLVLWVISLGTIGSFNIIDKVKFFGLTFFEAMDYLTSNIMLPLGGFLVAVFIGWRVFSHESAAELELNPRGLSFRFWRFSMRYVAPIAIFCVFLSSIGVL